MTLLICVFVIGLSSLILIGMFKSSTAQLAALRNTAEYERALYLAGAAAHQALAELEQNANWSAGISPTEFPAGSGHTYSATIVDIGGGEVVITGVGVSGSVTRRIQVTVAAGS